MILAPRLCVLHLLVPLLWITFILIICVLITRRVSLQKQLLGPITLAILLLAAFVAIFAIWVADYGMTTDRRTGLFKEQRFYDWYNTITVLSMVTLLILGGEASLQLYRGARNYTSLQSGIYLSIIFKHAIMGLARR